MAKARAFDEIADLLYPKPTPTRDWDHSTLEIVAEIVISVYPNAHKGERVIAKE